MPLSGFEKLPHFLAHKAFDKEVSEISFPKRGETFEAVSHLKEGWNIPRDALASNTERELALGKRGWLPKRQRPHGKVEITVFGGPLRMLEID